MIVLNFLDMILAVILDNKTLKLSGLHIQCIVVFVLQNTNDEADPFPPDEANPPDDNIPELDEYPLWDQGQLDVDEDCQPVTVSITSSDM